jgi:fido (protein-threonine AMPylation protein)
VADPLGDLHALADLLDDFGLAGWTEETAFQEVSHRSQMLADSLEPAAGAVARAVRQGFSMPFALQSLLHDAHRRLFRDILTNAGQPRRSADPNGGRVYFGGQKGDTTAPRFSGTAPDQIDAALAVAFARLEDRRTEAFDPTPDRRMAARDAARDAAVLFYADLSFIHPFYDANGRTGRFVVSVYLHLHGLYVEWGRLEAQDRRFVKRINEVKKRTWGQVDHVALLLRFWSHYVVAVEELEPGDEL